MSVKAFDIVPAIERLVLMSDKAKTQIVCLECCGKNLYLGTDDCYVVHFVLEEKTSPVGKVTYESEKQGMKFLGLKKPVVGLKAASALTRILVLCDNTLTLLNMFDLQPIVSGAKIKGVVTFCLNDNPVKGNPFSVEICVALKKRSVQIYTVTEDRMILQKDVALPEPPLAMAMDGHFVCVGLSSQYRMVDYETSQQQELFPIDSEVVNPLVTRITREEFLLSAPSALGMFAASSGISQRPPLQWSDNLVAVIFSHPYILALNDEFITIHSLLDQQQKQSIPFQGGVYLGEFDGRIFIASARQIYALVPIAFEKQIQGLLADQRVAEALDLAKNAKKTGLSKDRFLKMYRRIQQQAGFIEFSLSHFEEARQLFHNSRMDVRELISLYPGLLPESSDFTRVQPPLHEIADVNQLVRGDQGPLVEYRHFLRTYLEEIRGTREAQSCQMEVDTALLKLYAETDSPELQPLIVAAPSVDTKSCVSWLEAHGQHHACGLLHRFTGSMDAALHVWTRIYDGDLHDDSFPGIDFIVEFLAHVTKADVVWKYADWVLDRDESLGVKIFIERPTEEVQSEHLRADQVVDFLVRYPRAVITYLEFLIFMKKLELEKYHTHLAVLYLDRVIQLRQDPATPKMESDRARSELRHLLQVSRLYRVQLLLGKMKEHELDPECAILYGKLEDHDKALRILVHKLRDFGAAENYCVVNSQGRDLSYRKRLFQSLLTVYLDPNNERGDSLVAPAVSLLNNNKADFDTVKVLHLLPDNWSVGLLSQFLTSSIRKSLHGSRQTHIERTLARSENLRTKHDSSAVCHDAVALAEDRACAVCNRSFTEPTFVRYPNGIVTHINCAKNKYICPVTGKLFSTCPAASPQDNGS